MRYIEIEILSLSSIPEDLSLGSTSLESDSASNAPVVVSPIPGPSNQQSEDQVSEQAMQKCSNHLVHASYCSDANCRSNNCQKMKILVSHYHSCIQSKEDHMKCPTCINLFALFRSHAEQYCTTGDNCPVPLCAFFKQKLPLIGKPATVQNPSDAPSDVVVNQQQSKPRSMDEVIQKVFETLELPNSTPEGKQRLFNVISSSQLAPQLVSAFHSKRSSLQVQLNQQKEDLADLHQLQMRRQIQHLDEILTFLQQAPIAGPKLSGDRTRPQASSTQFVTHPASTWKRSLLSDLCALPHLDETKMSQFLLLVSDKTVDVNFPHWPLSLLLRNNQSESLVPCLKSLLQRPEINLETMGTCGHNALTILCRYNSTNSLIDCIKLLIQRGVDVLKADSHQRNTILLVCEFYQGEKMMELMQLLLHHGTNVLQVNKRAENALFLLCRHYKRGDLIDSIRLLISRGVKMDCDSTCKYTALHPLCKFYSRPDLLPILKLLVQYGIDATAEDDNEENALTLLCRYYRQPNLLEIIRFLVNDCDLDVNKVQGDVSRSAFVIMCKYQSNGKDWTNIVRFFIQQGVDLATADAQGRNILDILSNNLTTWKRSEIMRLLNETQVDVESIDSN